MALAYIDLVAAVVGSLAQAGASAYGTRETSKASRADLKLRKQELTAVEKQNEAELAARERMHKVEAELQAEHARLRAEYFEKYTPVLAAAAGVAALGIAAVVVVKAVRGKRADHVLRNPRLRKPRRH